MYIVGESISNTQQAEIFHEHNKLKGPPRMSDILYNVIPRTNDALLSQQLKAVRVQRLLFSELFCDIIFMCS